MRIVLILSLSFIAGCCLQSGAGAPVVALAEAAPASAEPQEMPSVRIDNTGDGGFFYHHVWADCAFLHHGHGRNHAWGRWLLPREEVTHSGIVSDGHAGFEIRYACKDASACIQSGTLEETPQRVTGQAIPFGTQARAQAWLNDVQKLSEACDALR